MNTKSKIIRVLYFASGSISEDVMKNLINKISEKSDSMNIEKSTKTLKNHGLINITKGEKGTNYELTESGQERVEKLLTGSEIENEIMNTVKKSKANS